jgi:hypothetical protein
VSIAVRPPGDVGRLCRIEVPLTAPPLSTARNAGSGRALQGRNGRSSRS